MLEHIGGDGELCKHLVVALKNLYRVPALLLLGHIVYGGLLDMRYRVLDNAGEGVHGDGLCAFRRLYRGLGCKHNAVALERGYLMDLTAQLPRKLLDVYLVAVFAHHVHHVYRNDDGDAKLGELSRQVEIALKICAVHDIQDRVGTLVYQVVTRHDLL